MRKMSPISPEDISKEKNLKDDEKSDKGNIEKRLKMAKNLNPVVLLDRLPKDYCKGLTVSPPPPRLVNVFVGHKAKGQQYFKNMHGKKKQRSSWPEAYEGCSYDDSLTAGEEGSLFLHNSVHEGVDKDADKDEPEVDVIDGVKFLSFLHEPDIRKYSCFHPSYDTFFSDWGSENSRDSSFSDDFKQLIIPTKTRDITQIKGWRKKLFGDCNEYATMPPEDDHPRESSPKLNFYDSDNEKDDFYHPAMGTCDEGEIIFDEDKSPSKSDVDQDTLESHLVLSKVEFKAANSESAFQSKGLEEFLGQKSELNIGLLSQYNPNVKVIEKDSPILAVGTLKKDDYVPPWKKLMERQRKRKELLESFNSRREAEAARENKTETPEQSDIQDEPEKPKIDVVEAELGNKIVWLDDEDSDSDQVEQQPPQVQSDNENKDYEMVEEPESKFDLEAYKRSEEESANPDLENDSSHSDDQCNKKETLEETREKLIDLSNIKQEPEFEESTKENSISEKNAPISPERAKREKKLSWKMLNAYQKPKKGKRNKSPLLNADSNRKEFSMVEEPIKISLKHSPDRSSWVINNVISESEFAARKRKGKRKIRNYSYIYSNEEALQQAHLIHDKLPRFEIITQTVWSKNKVLEKEFYQFLSELKNTLYEDAMRRYQYTTIFEDEPFPTLTEWDAMAACHSLNMVPKLHSEKQNAGLQLNGTKILSEKTLPGKKNVSRLAQLQNSLKFMDVDSASLFRGETSRGRVTNPPKRLLDSAVEIEHLSDDADDPNFRPTEAYKRKKMAAKSSNILESVLTNSPLPKELDMIKSTELISDEAILIDDSDDDSSNRPCGVEKPNVLQTTVVRPNKKAPVVHSTPSPNNESTSPVVVNSSPGAAQTSDDIIELPSPEALKSGDEDVAVMIKKRPKEHNKKRKRQNRELQKTLILKSFRQVTSGNTVLKSLIVANTNISSKAKDNMSLGLCAVGLTLNKANEGKNDIFLLYGRINDSVYNDAVRKSFYEEQHGIQTHHFVVPIVLEITKAAMKSSSDLKLVKIPLKGRALIDNQTESAPLMLYPVATKPPDEDLVDYSSKNDCEALEVPSAIPRCSSSSQDSFASVKMGKDVRRVGSSMLKKVEEVPKKKNKVVRIGSSDDMEGEIDILARSDDEIEISVPPLLAKKPRFMALNRTEPICRIKDKPLRPLLPFTAKVPDLVSRVPVTCPRPVSGINFAQTFPRVVPANLTPATPRSVVPIVPRTAVHTIRCTAPTPPVFSGTFGASKALATLVADSQAQANSKPTNITIKGITLNGTADDDATLVKKILSDPKPVNGNAKTKELKLLSTKQLSMISGIVESTQPDPPDQGLDQELRSAAQAAWQLFGPCIVRRVKLKNGNVVYVYQCANQTDATTPPSPLYKARPTAPIQPKTDGIVSFTSTTALNNPITTPRATVSPQQSKLPILEKALVNFPNITKSTKTYAVPLMKTSTINHVRGSSVVPLSQPSITKSPALSSPPVVPVNITKAKGLQTTLEQKTVVSELKKPRLDTGASDISSLPKGIVSPIPIQPQPKFLASAPGIVRPIEKKFESPPSPPLSPQSSTETKPSSYNKENSSVASLNENDSPNTSVWIGTDGEPCYVMRLDDNEGADAEMPSQTEDISGSQDNSKVPTIIECFPISEEQFQKNESSNVEAVT